MLKGKRTILVVLIVLGLSSFAVGSDSDSLVVEYQFKTAVVESFDSWMIEDTLLQETPGEPLIPYRSARILLPEGTEVKDVKVKHSEPIIEKGIDIPWGQLPRTTEDIPAIVGRNEEIYNSDQWYPHELYSIASTESFRGFKILNVILYPVQYQPKSKTVKFYETLYVHVEVKKGSKNELYRGLQCDKEAVRGMVDNPEMAETYEGVGTLPFSEPYEYIIITNSTLQSEFEKLADHKAFYVNGTNVYTVSWIYSNYSGVDNQEKIRNFIKDMYTNNGLKYVLLGGDVSVVPYRGFYVSCYWYTDDDMAADMYYAHLDGTWDNDSDGRYGESGEEDWYAEVAVGRAPVETVAEAQNFVNKVIAYERADKPEKVQFHAVKSDPDPRCLPWNCDDWVPSGWTKNYLLEDDGHISKDDWRNAWATNPLIVQHIGCDSTTTCYKINCVTEGAVTWCCSDVPTLTNTFWPWHTSPDSLVGQFTSSDCLAECYVKDDCGAIACYANDSYCWHAAYDACMYNGEFVEMQFKALFSAGKEKFGDLLNQSKMYMVASAQSNCLYRWCFYEINLIGDPETPCLTKRSYIEITNPEDGSEVSGTVEITAAAHTCVTEVEFWVDKNKNGYVDDGDLYDKTGEPFQCDWDTTTYPEGEEFTVYALAYSSGVYKGYDTATVTINNHCITSPGDRSKVCCGETVSITTSAAAGIDTVKFYLMWISNNVTGVLLCTDTSAPFECNWDTTSYSAGWYTIRAEAYSSGNLKNVDQILIKLVIC